MARFFIDRPIFAWVIAILIMFVGLLSLSSLPVAQYPEIAPPQVNIQASYPGANAKTIEDSVTQVIEQNINGLDGFRYMDSSSTSEGNVTITVTFNQGTNPDMAQVQVQNKISQALTTLPKEVQDQGVTVRKSSGKFFLIASFYSTDGQLSQGDIGDYINTTIKDPLSRIQGVGEIQFFGSGYSMRVWLNPMMLHKYSMTPLDVMNAIREQNTQVAFGQLGAMPVEGDQEINFTVTSQTRLETVDEFNKIQLRANEDGSQVLLADVARIEIATEHASFTSRYNSRAASALAISLASGANALATGEAVKAELKRLESLMPTGMSYGYPYDTTPFVEISIANVVTTLIEAIGLVFIVMYLFLRNFRATLIPTLAIPVVLLGTFIVLSAFGFILNTLTLFAMVLGIGLLVDDAIVVVENVERIMEEEGLSPIEATRKSMDQITGALIGIAMVISAVFVPMAFLGGASGVIYRQFSVTIITAMTLSVVIAIIFTPALCATMLLPHGTKYEPKGIMKPIALLFSPLTNLINKIIELFNRGFDHTNKGYEKSVRSVLTRPKRYLMVFLVILVAMGYGFMRLPKSFLPDEDQGILIGMVIAPDGTSLNQTQATLEKISQHILTNEKDSIAEVMAVGGFSFSGRGGNHGVFFMRLLDWDKRTKPSQKVGAISMRLQGYLSTLKEVQGFSFAPPPIIELGTATGVSFTLQNGGGLSHEEFFGSVQQFMGIAAQTDPKDQKLNMQTLRPGGQFDRAQYQVDIDQEKARALQISTADINQSLSIAWGGLYVNDFVDRGRVKKVMLQADSDFRMQTEDFDKWYVRNKLGEMVPFSAFAKGRWTSGAAQLNRFNGYPSFPMSISAKPGFSTGDAMDQIESIVKTKLPQGVNVEWVDTSYEERQTGNIQTALYAASIFVIFLSLAALYESWSIPFAVLLAIPVGVVGSILAGNVFILSNDVYFQVGMLTVIGLTAKNAILIVEFARDLVHQGKSIIDATVEAAHQRLRPILMTSFAFGFGVLPLALSSGAGSGAQNVVGITVVGGMVVGTFLVLFYAPIFFTFISGKGKKKEEA